MAAAVGGGGDNGGVASQLVDKVTVMLNMHLQTGCFKDPLLFVDLLLTLARGIDHAVANNEVPSKSQDLPLLLKKVYQCKNDYDCQAAFMILMMSVKSACQIGWFANREKDDLLMMAKELRGRFSDIDSMSIEPAYAHPYIQKIISRFYPKMKMDRLLASFDVKSGYGAYVLDFNISKGMVAPEREKMWLFVARADDFDTSSCIVSPPEVSFLLNTMKVPGRTNIDMCNGPQLPTNVTAMLKFGVNLLQAIGNFNGHYIIALAVMSLISSVDPPLQDYLEPVSTTVDSDSEVIEMSSRISLNCPYSRQRMKTPVKGHLCKHRQCFDFNNYLKINSRRPSWRCPHCNQPVCFPDIRIDRNIAKVLTEVEKNIADVIILADRSWKPVLENKDDSSPTNDSTHVDHQERVDQCETSSQTLLNSTSTTVNHVAPGLNNIYQILPSAFLTSASSLRAHQVNKNCNTTPLTTLRQSQVPTQAVSSSLQNHLQFQQTLGFPPISNGLHGRYPGAMWPPTSYSHMHGRWQTVRNLDSSMPTSASSSMSPTIPSFPQYDALNRGMGAQLNPTSAYVSGPSVLASGSYPMQHHFVTQGICGPGNEHVMCAQLNPASVHVSGPSDSYPVQHHFATQGNGSPTQNPVNQGTIFRPPSMQQSRHHPYNHLQSHPPQASNNYQNMAHGFPRTRPHELRRDGPFPTNSTTHQGQCTTPSVPFQPTPSRTNSSVQISLPMMSEQQQNKIPHPRYGPTPTNSKTPLVQCTTPSVPFQTTPSRTNSAVQISLPMMSEQQQNKIPHPRYGPTPTNSKSPLVQCTTPSVPFQTSPSRTNSAVQISLPMMSEQQQNKGKDGLSETQRPIGRMRGSLTGEEANAYRQYILRPPQQAVQASRPAQPTLNQRPVIPNTMPWGMPNYNTFNPASNVPRAESQSAYTMNLPRSFGSLPARSQGTH